jgi:hypothetical protein
MILKTSFKYLFILLAGMALVLNSCKEDCPSCQDPTNPDCDNYDPCWNKQPVTGDFEISQQPVTFYPDYIGDWHPDLKFFRGLIGFRPVNFIEGDTSVKYTWLLGSEVVHDYYLERDFSDTEQSGENNIRITLIVEKEPDLDCFPLDDGKDTITKYIQLVDNTCEFLTFGDFKVLFEGDKDSTTVSVRGWELDFNKQIVDSCNKDNSIQYINFDNEKEGMDTIWNMRFAGLFYSKASFYESKGGEGRFGNLMNGKFAINPDTWECEAEYQVNYRPLGPVQRFKGRKIR